MYISKIKINQIKCFSNLEINLEDPDKNPYLWTTLVGDNSAGKTCLLRCIAIGLCDETSGAGLIKELEGDFLRRTPYKKEGSSKGTIEITLKEGRSYYVITTTVRRRHGREDISQDFEPRDFSKLINKIFVCGYGVQRAGDNNNSFRKYSALEAVYSLFQYSASLQDPEIILRRRSPTTRKALFRKLERILMLDSQKNQSTLSPKSPIRLVKNGVRATGPWGDIFLDEMSDGYWSTLCWLVDFVGWQTYYNPNFSLDNKVKGIILLDELELHLHPSWQRYIVERLKREFPDVQFITTTHSPLVAAGVEEVDDAKLIALRMRDGQITADHNLSDLKGMRADQVLTSDVFSLPTSVVGETGDKLVDYRNLFLKDKLNNREKAKYKQLEKELKDLPEAGETVTERKEREEIKLLLEQVKSMMEEK